MAAVWVLESMVDWHDCCDGCKSMLLLLVPPSRLVGLDEHEQEQIYTRPHAVRTMIKQEGPPLHRTTLIHVPVIPSLSHGVGI